MFWRSVGSSQNAFAVESFIDECAHAAKRDPLEYRRGLLEGRPDFLDVLDALAEKGDWGKPLRKGVGRGVAISVRRNSNFLHPIDTFFSVDYGFTLVFNDSLGRGDWQGELTR
jgi:CO/xanthine dehydrogenase Mo-binding subunit